MTVAVGNLIVAVIAAINYPKELVSNFFLYAFLMLLCSFVFVIFTKGFVYRTSNTFASTKLPNGPEFSNSSNEIEVEMNEINLEKLD